jgi:alkanesulfonate monooxygenase
MSLFHHPNLKSIDTKGLEIAWFAPLCNDDYEWLGQPDPGLKSTFAHTQSIFLKAERLGFKNILCPSSYQVGQDTWTFASAMGAQSQHMNLLVAIRCAEVHPVMLARAIATLDHMVKGRLTINIISSDLPGETMSSRERYQRSRECIQILKQAFSGRGIEFKGTFYNCKADSEPAIPYQTGGPLFYFGGFSEEAKELCAEFCDVYLMWPETKSRLAELRDDLLNRAAKFNRKIDFGLRIHTVVRDSEEEARSAAQKLVSRLDDQVGTAIRSRALDSISLGVARQAEMREWSDSEGYVEPHLWTGIGRARSGCGGALVGSGPQVVSKLKEYQDMGFRAFILSGYPHSEEMDHVAKHILPHFDLISFPHSLGKVPDFEPPTPLGSGPRF